MPALSFAQSAGEEKAEVSYITATQKDMAKLTWKYNLHDIDSNKIIDEHIMVQNCELYQKYIGEDFEWQRIRQGTRNEINAHSGSYPDRFEINALLPVGRYDFERAAFHILDNAKLDNAGSILIPFHGLERSECAGDVVDSKLFPRFVKFVPDNKFSLTYIPVAKNRANEIINNVKRYKYPQFHGQRVFPVRFRIKVNSIKDYQPKTTAPEITFRGQLDDITFFEDPLMTKVVWSKSFKSLD